MTLDRFETILDAYGADPDRWPSAERSDAEALLARSSEARALRDATARLDTVLDAAPDATPSAPLTTRILDAAPVPSRTHGRRLVAALAPLAAAALVVLWLARSPTVPPTAAPTIPLAALGVYETSTDTLLSLPGLDVLDAVPTLSCPDSELGCLDATYDRATTERTERILA